MDPMETERNKRVVRSFFEAGNAGDLPGCLALLAEDVVWTNAGTTPVSGTFTGKQAVVEELLGPVFGQLQAGIRSTVDNVVAEGEFVVVQSRGRAATLDGTPYNNSYCHVFRLSAGRIVAVTEYLDTDLARRVFANTGA